MIVIIIQVKIIYKGKKKRNNTISGEKVTLNILPKKDDNYHPYLIFS